MGIRRHWVGLLLGLLAVPGLALCAPPSGAGVYASPMAVIDGHGGSAFHVTLGMLVDKDHAAVGLYRSYPSRGSVPLSELYGLGMLGTGEGAVLASYRGIPLLVLHGHIGAQPGTYPLTVSYLASATARRYARCTLYVRRSAQGQWSTVDAGGHAITRFVVDASLSGISHISHCSP